MRRTIILIIFGIIYSGCSDELPTEPIDSIYPDLGLGPADSSEARDMALYWDNTLQGSDTTFESLLYHLNYLRSVWGDSLPWIKTQRFMLPWMPGELIVGLDSVAAEAFRNGTFSGFSDLEEDLQPDSISDIGRSDFVVLFYDVQYNMRVFANQFNNIQGVRYTEPNGIMWIGIADFPMRYGIIDDEWAFILLHNNLFDRIHYFSYELGQPHYWGQINFSDTDSTIIADYQNVRAQWSDRDG